MGDGTERYREALDLFGTVVDKVGDDRWEAPSPCSGWTAAGVVGHVIQGTRMILAVAAQAEPVAPAPDPAAVTGVDPRYAWHVRREEIDALLGRLDVDAVVQTGQGPLRVDDGMGQAVIEPLVHAWDLASATGQRVSLPDHLVEPLLAMLEPVEPIIRSSGMFADRVPVADDAAPQERLLAFLGRRD
jgi:uncharacterized protein (TIGR03086 family)